MSTLQDSLDGTGGWFAPPAQRDTPRRHTGSPQCTGSLLRGSLAITATGLAPGSCQRLAGHTSMWLGAATCFPSLVSHTIAPAEPSLDVTYLILHLIRRHLIENAQEAAHDLRGWMTHSDNDAIVSLPRGQVLFGEGFEVGAIMGEKRLALTDGVGQLLSITVLELASLACSEL
jgi:hypothetical protein